MARTVRTRSNRSSVRSRKFIWARRTYTNQVLVAGVNWLNLLDQFEAEYGAQLLGATVMRIRGTLAFEAAVTAPVLSGAGILVSTDEDISDGVDEGPVNEPHKDWMAYQPIILSNVSAAANRFDWELDVKSNRRMEELGQGLALVVDNGIAATTIDMTGAVSVGVKLP